MKPIWSILLGVIIGTLSGVGMYQIATAGTVARHTTQIENLQSEFKQEQERTDKRIFALVEMVNKTFGQNTEFITLLREQNAVYRQMLINDKKP